MKNYIHLTCIVVLGCVSSLHAESDLITFNFRVDAIEGTYSTAKSPTHTITGIQVLNGGVIDTLDASFTAYRGGSIVSGGNAGSYRNNNGLGGLAINFGANSNSFDAGPDGNNPASLHFTFTAYDINDVEVKNFNLNLVNTFTALSSDLDENSGFNISAGALPGDTIIWSNGTETIPSANGWLATPENGDYAFTNNDILTVERFTAGVDMQDAGDILLGALRVTVAVPEPATANLLLGSVILSGTLLRRRRR